MKGIALSISVFIILLTGCNNTRPTPSTSPADPQHTVEQTMRQTSEQVSEVIVTFVCTELERLIREKLNKPTGEITSTEMLELYDIRANGDNISSLSGLEYALNLVEFGVLRNEIELESLDPISNLTSLERINLSYTQVKDPVTLGKLDKVYYFALIDTNISDISFLADMTAIEHLTMTNCGISDIHTLAGLTKLTQVNLNRNNIESIEALRGKDKIETLNLQGNLVSDISPLAELTNLRDVTLSYNPITNLKPLEELPYLESVRIYLDHDVKHLIFDHVKILEEKGIEVDYHR